MVTSSYNEPLITAEWAVEVFKSARCAGLKTAFVSNGNLTAEVMDFLKPWVDCYKVDLKSMQDKNYRRLGGRLQIVLDGIRRLVEEGFWVEVVTLVVPGFNDSEGELAEAASFLRSVSADIPWHVTAFHPDYRMRNRSWTSASTLLRAVEIGRGAGLNFVYAGNLAGRVERLEDTICPACGSTLVERRGFRVLRNSVGAKGHCPGCGVEVPGVWN